MTQPTQLDTGTPTYLKWGQSKTPRWLKQFWGGTLVDAMMSMVDAVITGVIDAVDTRFIARRTIDALPYAAKDRRMYRARNETNEAFRARLMGSWELWASAGSGQGLVDALNGLNFNIIPTHNTVAETIETNVGGDWWVYTVHIRDWPSEFFTTTWVWGASTHWGADRIWGGFDPYMLSILKILVEQFRPAHAVVKEIVIHMPDTSTMSIKPLKPGTLEE